jgi:type I restriction enzyme S subunit
MVEETTKIIPKGYKRTEVGIIPKNWEVKSLGDLLSFSGGYSASRDQLSEDGFCYLHYGDIHGSTKQYMNVTTEFLVIPKLNIKLSNVSRKSLLSDGDVVFVDASEDDEGTSKHVVVRNPDGIPYISGLHTIVSKSKDDSFNSRYKEYCFQTNDIKRQFKFYAVGTKVSGISKTNIAKIFIPLPLKLEQKAIAGNLCEIDALISSFGKLIAKKRAIKQGVMQKLLTGKRRLPGFSGKWETKSFGSLIELRKGEQLNKSELTETGEYPDWNGGIEPSGYTHKWNTIENTITISEGGNSCGFVNFCKQKFWLGGHCYALKITADRLDKNFLFQLLKYMEKAITNLRIGSGLPNIQKKNLNEFELFLSTDVHEQTVIASVLRDMDAEIDTLDQKLAKYKMFKQGMMQALLTGRIRLV